MGVRTRSRPWTCGTGGRTGVRNDQNSRSEPLTRESFEATTGSGFRSS